MAVREQRIPGYTAERLFEGILRFRTAWPRYHRPEDVNHLLRLFPHVHIQSGYVLDYLPMAGTAAGWIWPYVRREAETQASLPRGLASIERDRLAGQRGSGELKRVEIESLYRYLTYDISPNGLFEYAVFISELWATKSASKAAEWLDLEPIFTKRTFDGAMRRAKQVVRVIRPELYDPLVRVDSAGGGEAEFLVFHAGPWKRIFYLKCRVDADGFVQRSEGALVANLG